MANGTIHKLGTLRIGGTKYPFPTKPWRKDRRPGGASEPGNIIDFDYGTSGKNIEIIDTDPDDAYQLRWVEVNDGDKRLLISDRCLLNRISWKSLKSEGLVSGKEVVIDGQKYKLRLLTGGDRTRIDGDRYSGGSPVSNEWERIIVNEGSFDGLPTPVKTDLDNSVENSTDFNGVHNKFWNWCSIVSWCQESYYLDSTESTIRGCYSARYFNTYKGDSVDNYYGWRPVLEVLNSTPTITNIESELGEHSNPLVQQYTISDNDGDKLSIVEKLNGSVIRTLENQNSNVTLTLDLSAQWEQLDFLVENVIEIEVKDSKGATTVFNARFTKVKKGIEKLPSEATLTERANFIQDMNKELEYQSNRLREILISQGVNTDGVNTLSELISKIKLLFK